MRCGVVWCDNGCVHLFLCLDERCPTPVKRVLHSQSLARFFSRRLYEERSEVYHINHAAETVSQALVHDDDVYELRQVSMCGATI